MGSQQKPYQQALEAFQREIGQRVQILKVEEVPAGLPSDAKVIVALGGRAAIQAYPPGVALVYGLAPGVVEQRRRSTTVKVQMIPRPVKLLGKVKELQPGLARLGVLWSAAGSEYYVRELRKAGETLDVEVVERRLAGPDELPEALRALAGKVDALWLPPDPSLINLHSLETIKQFSWANAVPFYAPSAGMLDYGAVASVDASFAEIGRALARAARSASGGSAPPVMYPEEAVTSINSKAASEVGLKIPAGAARP